MANLQQIKTWDAIVVGSGITGGWAAKELTEKGLEVLVLEAGRDIDPRQDYTEHTPPWSQPFRGLGDRNQLAEQQPIQRNCYACDEGAHQFFVNDKDEPYTQASPFLYLRGRQVGGRSLLWGRQVYRWSDLDFEANSKDGHGVDWPVRYADLAPWYDYVEDFIGVSGEALGLPHLPDSKFLPPMDFNCAELKAKAAIAKKWNGARPMTIGRVAVLTREHRGRAACHYCGPCHRGCRTGSYFSSLSATLPAAAATGRLTLRPHSVVHSLGYDPKSNKVNSVRVIDGLTRETVEYRGRVVFLCASTLESARLLLNSNDHAREGLANSSGQVGRNLMDHLYNVGAAGVMMGLRGEELGRRPNGIYVPRFVNLKNETSGSFVRGYGFQGGGFRFTWQQSMLRKGFGADFKDALRNEIWAMAFLGFGECLPHPENRATIDPQLQDKWGVPALRIDMRFRENEQAMVKDIQEKSLELAEAAGVFAPQPWGALGTPGIAIHEMGTARMGRDPETSVLNGWNQAWDVPNLFVTDGACMASSACQNPSLTYMALTARAADYAVRQMADGRL